MLLLLFNVGCVIGRLQYFESRRQVIITVVTCQAIILVVVDQVRGITAPQPGVDEILRLVRVGLVRIVGKQYSVGS